MRRPIQWVGDDMPQFAEHLPAPPKHEWLEVVKYWNGGGRDPVWFVADPLRSDLALVHSQRRPTLLPMAVSDHGAARRRAAERDGLARHRVAGLVSGRRVGAHAGNGRHRPRGPPRARALRPITRLDPAVAGADDADDRRTQSRPGGAPGRVTRRVRRLRWSRRSQRRTPGFFLRMIDACRRSTATGDYAIVDGRIRQPAAGDRAVRRPASRARRLWVWRRLERAGIQPVDRRARGAGRAIGRRSACAAEGQRLALTLRGEIEAASSSHVVVRAGDGDGRGVRRRAIVLRGRCSFRRRRSPARETSSRSRAAPGTCRRRSGGGRATGGGWA